MVKKLSRHYVERWNTLLGSIFVIVILFMPLGLVPGFKQLWKRMRAGTKPRRPDERTTAPETVT